MELLTLDAALEAVARRSFYEDCVVIPIPHPVTEDVLGYLVENDSNVICTDDITWTYADGISRGSENEITRLMESYEFFDAAHHIRYNLSDAVEELESGNPVWFAYAVVHDGSAIWDDDGQVCRDADGDEIDPYAGWCLMAQWEDR